MTNLVFIIAINSFIMTRSLSAQTVSVMPQSVSGIGIFQTGNTVAGKCDGSSPQFIKLSIQPSCYGGNLRGGSGALDPNGGDVEMDLTISNAGSNYNTTIRFPNQVTWPENYGQTCRWSSTSPASTVACDHEGQVIDYTCNLKPGKNFISNSLDCSRLGDPLSHGALNNKLICSMLYSWKGEDYAATNSYRLIQGVANCGLRDRNVDYVDKTIVTSSVPPSSINKYSKRGKVVISYNGLNISKQSVTKDNTTGKFIVSGNRSQVKATFSQYDQSGGKKSISQKVATSFDDFEECLEVKVAFLGANQFCGSFYSPIMLFFDNQLPQFAGTSSFPLVEGVRMIYWPEAKAPGYFLAVDEFDTGRISSNKQLFGEGADYKNGFEALSRYDSNKDGVIDSKDKMFSKFVLWRDLDGNGISEKGELFSLASLSVKSISLKYKDDNRQSFGRRAEARQEATFTFSKEGKDQVGRAIDIWFSPNTMASGPSVKKGKK